MNSPFGGSIRGMAVVFVVLSIVLAAIAAKMGGADVSVDSTLDRAPVQSAPAAPASGAPAPTAPAGDDPLAGVAG